MRRWVAILVVQAMACTALALGQSSPSTGASAYNSALRPDPDGVATEVSVAALMIDLTEIDDVKQEFTIDLVIVVSWRDSRLAATSSEMRGERILPLASVWHPALSAINRRDATFLLPETVRIDPEGQVVYTQRFYGQIGTPLDLREFPADTQTLKIQIASFRHSPEEVVFEIDPARTRRLERTSVTGWKVGQPRIVPSQLELPGIKRAGVTFEVDVERETSYYLLTMVLPLLLIALMAWAVFWIDPTLLPSQVGIATASVFTLIAFRLSLSLQLPKISYLTVADWFALTATLLVFGALGETVLTGRLAKMDRGDLARRIDFHARWIYLLALALLCALTVPRFLR